MSGFDVPDEPARIPSGVSGLDTLLRGGWLRGGTYIIAGAPGAGKTILGNQFCFSCVARGGQAVYATVLAESHGRMMKHLEPLGFFQREAVGRSLHYVSAYAPLKSEGLSGLSRLLFHAVREHQASALVVDGLSAIQEAAESRLAFREFLNSLAVHNGLTDCTTLLLTSHPGAPLEPHFALVDGVALLHSELDGPQARRRIEVTKLRGTGQLTGRHAFSISEEGLCVYPRTELLHPALARVVPDPGHRRAFGLKGLDAMVGGGLVAHSSTLMMGSPGSGKTLLGLHWLAQGARQGQPGLYLGFSETGPRLVQKAALVGLDVRPEVASGLLVLEAQGALESLPDALARRLLERVERLRVERLFVDGLEPFVQDFSDPRRTPRFFTALTHALCERRVTSLWTEQTPLLFGPQLHTTPPEVGAIVDNLLFLRYVEIRSKLQRMLCVLKMRESDNDPHPRLFSITPQGIDVTETFESAQALLTGEARPLSPGRGAGSRKGAGARKGAGSRKGRRRS